MARASLRFLTPEHCKAPEVLPKAACEGIKRILRASYTMKLRALKSGVRPSVRWSRSSRLRQASRQRLLRATPSRGGNISQPPWPQFTTLIMFSGLRHGVAISGHCLTSAMAKWSLANDASGRRLETQFTSRRVERSVCAARQCDKRAVESPRSLSNPVPRQRGGKRRANH
jgi:hypothetical protein